MNYVFVPRFLRRLHRLVEEHRSINVSDPVRIILRIETAGLPPKKCYPTVASYIREQAIVRYAMLDGTKKQVVLQTLPVKLVKLALQ